MLWLLIKILIKAIIHKFTKKNYQKYKCYGKKSIITYIKICALFQEV